MKFKTSLPLIMILSLLFSSRIIAAELSVTLDKSQAEMGKYFLADIRYQGENVSGEFNLSEWQDNFYVDLQDSETVDIGINKELQQKTIRVRLYPRRSGQITLASIAFGGAIAKSSVITVKQSIRNGIDGTPVIQPIQQNYWSDQAIIIQVDVALHDPGNIVKSNDFEAEGFILQTLSTQRIQSAGVDVMRLKWLLLTPNKGHYEIELPAIHQRGRGRFRYHLPILKLNIKPLPAYLPPTIPVGSLTVHSEIIKPENQPTRFLLTIQKSGRIPEHVEGLKTLFEGLGLDRLDVEIENRIDVSTGRVSRLYQIPLPAWYFAQPNSIKIPYFDTTKGKLEYLQHQLPGIWLAPDYIKIIGGFIILLIIFYAGYRINNLAEKVRLWKRLQLQISHSNSAHQLRRLLLKIQPAKNLTEWSEHYNSSISDQIAVDLNALCYRSNAIIDLDQLKKLCLRNYSFKQYLNLDKSLQEI